MVTTLHITTKGKSTVYLCGYCFRMFVGSPITILRHLCHAVGVPQHIQALQTPKQSAACFPTPTAPLFVSELANIVRVYLATQRSKTKGSAVASAATSFTRSLPSMFGSTNTLGADDAILKCFIHHTLSHTLTESMVFKAMVKAIYLAGPNYLPPGRRRLAGWKRNTRQ